LPSLKLKNYESLPVKELPITAAETKLCTVHGTKNTCDINVISIKGDTTNKRKRKEVVK